jgi:hypothetical protein
LARALLARDLDAVDIRNLTRRIRRADGQQDYRSPTAAGPLETAVPAPRAMPRRPGDEPNVYRRCDGYFR